ncbi:ArdC family protein [Fimbriiglobus ruber]|uniref:ArdC family protein n=1 Tax=Fimbriiglobus ruber TaxID=1908690 RepID=UPI00137ACDAE|nr:ArdC-like ssDNA-binding domain-containing protein [Fimbriiglobus ruber]
MSIQTTDLRQRITDSIIEGIRTGCPAWRRPWAGGDIGRPANIVSRRAYSGVNVLALWGLAQERGFRSKFWGTYQQWQALGGQVRRRPDDIPQGHWGCRIIYCREVSRKRDSTDGERDEKYKLLRTYTVFNLDQVDGVSLEHVRYKPDTYSTVPNYQPAEHAMRATGADIRFGDRASYSRPGDYIQMPPREVFREAQEFYATVFHELAHWAEKRVGWSGSYAMGELVAEIAGCYTCSELAVPQSDDMTNHSAYVASWLREIEADPSTLMRAASQASKVTDYILSFSCTKKIAENVLIEVD